MIKEKISVILITVGVIFLSGCLGGTGVSYEYTGISSTVTFKPKNMTIIANETSFNQSIAELQKNNASTRVLNTGTIGYIFANISKNNGGVSGQITINSTGITLTSRYFHKPLYTNDENQYRIIESKEKILTEQYNQIVIDIINKLYDTQISVENYTDDVKKYVGE